MQEFILAGQWWCRTPKVYLEIRVNFSKDDDDDSDDDLETGSYTARFA